MFNRTGADAATSSPLSRDSIVRIVLDLLREEVAASRRNAAATLLPATWSEATRADGEGLDLDSLERLTIAAALNEFFHLHEYGAEDHLLASPSVGDWCDVVEQSLRATGTHLTFRTSGSTGTPNRRTHRVADLLAEAAGWADHLGPTGRLIALVPSHHIYGALFTAMLPDLTGCPVERAAGADAVARAAPGTVVIATPTMWAYLSRSLPCFPPGVTGVSSTAPMPARLAHQLTGQRLARLVEVYGSTETAGIAVRDRHDAPFRLLDRWVRGATGELTGADAEPVAMPDAAEWLDDRCFTLRGRIDGAVQIGGLNVFPDRVRDVLLAHAGVAEAAVRLDADTGRLKAFVVPAGTQAGDVLVGELDRWCGARVADVERPRRIAVGADLPRGAMGKPADW
ncbi:AMP-binding protein [uncultured Sphingomonas sp.]|uniref:AMP-binding protein n=1 Tax=uncultured Sphingomonas sp. TaxID=158754 RepID=UPI0035CB8F63